MFLQHQRFLVHIFGHTRPYTLFRQTFLPSSRYMRCCNLRDAGCAWTYIPACSPGTYKPPCPPVSWSLDKSLRPPGPTCRPEKYTAERESAWFEGSFSASAKPSAPPEYRTLRPRPKIEIPGMNQWHNGFFQLCRDFRFLIFRQLPVSGKTASLFSHGLNPLFFYKY